MASSWAVVLVHGVGDTVPGATLDALLVKALKKPEPGEQKVLAETAAPQLRLLAETEPGLPKPNDPDPRKPPPAAEESWRDPEGRFPMYVRSFTNSTQGEPKRVVFAEVFWADLSRARDSRLQVLLRAMALIFDLRHLADVASAEQKSRLAWALRRVLYAVSWLLCGPIAAVTAYVSGLLAAYYAAISIEHFAGAWGVVGVCLGAIGVVLVMRWKARVSPPPSFLSTAIAAGVMAGLLVLLALAAHRLGWKPTGEWGMAAFALAAALAMTRFSDARKRSARRPDGAWLLFAIWVRVAAAISLVVAALRLAGWKTFPWSMDLGESLALSMRLDPNKMEQAAAAATHAAVLLALGYWVFVLLAVTALMAFALWALARITHWRSGRKGGASLDAALGASFLQVTFWVVLGTAIGTFAVARLPDLRDTLYWVVIGFMLKLVVVVMIGGCALAVAAWRKVQVYVLKARTEQQVARLLVNGLVMRALHFLTIASVSLFAWIFATRSTLLGDYLGEYADEAVWVSGALAVVTGAPFALKAVRAILHILVDITSHFYRAQIDLRQELRAGEFDIQQRIEARMRRVLQEVLAPGGVTHLTVVAHSQGTMIAIDVLWLGWTRRLLEGVNVGLVTMGSPFTHLYQHYFPERYPPLFASDDPETPSWGEGLAATVDAWINIYRIDDYIGTRVDGRKGFPENHPTSTPGGHMNYWSDPEALKAMAPYLPRGLAIR